MSVDLQTWSGPSLLDIWRPWGSWTTKNNMSLIKRKCIGRSVAAAARAGCSVKLFGTVRNKKQFITNINYKLSRFYKKQKFS